MAQCSTLNFAIRRLYFVYNLLMCNDVTRGIEQVLIYIGEWHTTISNFELLFRFEGAQTDRDYFSPKNKARTDNTPTTIT
jgi:hypothetical protein